jgi:hypothetical protein
MFTITITTNTSSRSTTAQPDGKETSSSEAFVESFDGLPNHPRPRRVTITGHATKESSRQRLENGGAGL